jgi:formylglycine-generating enzyme required for sulfatase activity
MNAMTENRKLKVFLCHSKDDKSKVHELYRRLVDDGFDAWLDEEKLMPGQDWDLEIRKTVRDTDVVIVCLSNDSVTKTGYVQKEIRFALDVADQKPEGTIFIVPARLEDCQVPSRLHQWQWVDIFDENGYKKIHSSLKIRAKVLGIQPARKLKRLSFEPKMVRIPAGSFLMGSTKDQSVIAVKHGAEKEFMPWEQPQHIVELPEYFISKYPITNREFKIFAEDTGYDFPHDSVYRYMNNIELFPPAKTDHPVVSVSWADAFAYCGWLSRESGKAYRLPTEAEWEKAARGTDGRIWPWGNEASSNIANTKEAKIGDTTEVGRFSPKGDSPYGCSDMVGNVWEWCADRFDENEYKKRVKNNRMYNPLGAKKGDQRVQRGGSFSYNLGFARTAWRWGLEQSEWDDTLGFRIALSIDK